MTEKIIKRLVLELEPETSAFCTTMRVVVYINDKFVVHKAEPICDKNDFDDMFSIALEHAKREILETIKKLDAIEWDKQKIQNMAASL